MNRHHRALVVAGLLAALASAASAQTWEYKSYKKSGPSGQYDKDRFVLGTVTLEEKDGQATVHMVAGVTDACVRGDMPALVTRTDATTTIEPQIALAGCEKFRYVIRNDGSGGIREHQRGDRWVGDRFDHGLTPKR